MRTSKFFLFLAFATILSCDDSKNLPKRNQSIQVIANDPVFLEVMDATNFVSQNFDERLSSKPVSEGRKELARLGELLKLSQEEAYPELVKTLGYASISDFEGKSKKFAGSIQSLLEKFPTLKSGNGINQTLYKEVVKEFHKDIEYIPIMEESSSARAMDVIYSPRQVYVNLDLYRIPRTNPTPLPAGGCKGGSFCNAQFAVCYRAAESDYSLAVAGCFSALNYFPPYWAYCQGSALLIRAAERTDCGNTFEKCCGLS